MSGEQSFGLLVEATRALLHRKLPAHLLVIGNGEFSALSGLPEANYTRLPWVGHDQIPALIGRFDALPLTYPPVDEIPAEKADEVRALLESRIAGERNR